MRKQQQSKENWRNCAELYSKKEANLTSNSNCWKVSCRVTAQHLAVRNCFEISYKFFGVSFKKQAASVLNIGTLNLAV